MKTNILITFFLMAFACVTRAQDSRVPEKQKRTKEFIALAGTYDSKAKNGGLNNEELATLSKLFKENDKYLGSYITGEENQLIYNKLNRMSCLSMYINVLLRMKHNNEVAAIARQYFDLPDDNLIVDAATAKAAHQYDYGDRVNDKYDKIVTGGFSIQRSGYVSAAGSFYSGLIMGTALSKNYGLMDSLFLKGLKYGYFDGLPSIIRNTMGKNILVTYHTPVDYAPKYLTAAAMVKDSFDGLTEEQKNRESNNTANEKIKELFATALKQDITKPEGVVAFNNALKYLLQDKTTSDEEKVKLIKANIDVWILQAKEANERWLVDSDLYKAITYAITQQLLNPEDKVFCDKFCAFISSHGITVIKVNARLVYDCYLYYKNSGQKKEAKNFYKEHLERNYSTQYPK